MVQVTRDADQERLEGLLAAAHLAASQQHEPMTETKSHVPKMSAKHDHRRALLLGHHEVEDHGDQHGRGHEGVDDGGPPVCGAGRSLGGSREVAGRAGALLLGPPLGSSEMEAADVDAVGRARQRLRGDSGRLGGARLGRVATSRFMSWADDVRSWPGTARSRCGWRQWQCRTGSQ